MAEWETISGEVYVLIEEMDYEYTYVLGVYSTMERAQAVLVEPKGVDTRQRVLTVKLNEPPNDHPWDL
jgi:hypothetical protein